MKWADISALAKSIDDLWDTKVENYKISAEYGCKCMKNTDVTGYLQKNTLCPLMYDNTTPYYLGSLLPSEPDNYYLRFEYGYTSYGQNPVLLRSFLVDGPNSNTPVVELEPLLGTDSSDIRDRTQKALKNLREVRMGEDSLWDPYRDRWTLEETTPELFILTDEEKFPCICKSVFRLAPMHAPFGVGGGGSSNMAQQIADASRGNVMNPYMHNSHDLWDFTTIASLDKGEYRPRFDDIPAHNPWTPKYNCFCQTVTLPRIGQTIDPSQKSNDIIPDSFFASSNTGEYAGYNWGNHEGPEGEPVHYNYTNTERSIVIWDQFKYCEKDKDKSVHLQFENVYWDADKPGEPIRESVLITAAVRVIPANIMFAMRKRWLNLLWERMALITGRRLSIDNYKNYETSPGNDPLPDVTYARYVNDHQYSEGNSFTNAFMGRISDKCQCYRYAGRLEPYYPDLPPKPPAQGYLPQDPPDGGIELGTFVGMLQDPGLGAVSRDNRWGGIKTLPRYDVVPQEFCRNFQFQRVGFNIWDWTYEVQLPWDIPVQGGTSYNTENQCTPGATCTGPIVQVYPVNPNPTSEALPFDPYYYFPGDSVSFPVEYYPNKILDYYYDQPAGNVTPTDYLRYEGVQLFEYTLSYLRNLASQLRSMKATEGTREGACRFQFYGFTNGFYYGSVDAGTNYNMSIPVTKSYIRLYFWCIVPFGVSTFNIQYVNGLEGAAQYPCTGDHEGFISWYGTTGEVGSSTGDINFGSEAPGSKPGSVMSLPMMIGDGACRRNLKYMVGELQISGKSSCQNGAFIASTLNIRISFS